MATTPPPAAPLAAVTLGLVAFTFAALAAPLVADEVDTMGRDPSLQADQVGPIAVTAALALGAGALAAATLRRRFGRRGVAIGLGGALVTAAVVLVGLVGLGGDGRGGVVFAVTLTALLPGFGLWLWLLIAEIQRERTRFGLVFAGLVLVPITVPASALGIFTDELVRTGGHQAMSVALALVLPLALATFALVVASRDGAPGTGLSDPVG